MKTLATLSAIVVGAGLVSACSDAEIASHNLSKAADQFQVERRIVFYNGITDTYMLTIEGLCSIEADGMDKQLEVTFSARITRSESRNGNRLQENTLLG